MSDAAGLLARITALRQRLEQAQGILREVEIAGSEGSAADLAEQLAREVNAGRKSQEILDGSMRQIAGPAEGEDVIRPDTLVARARDLLGRGRRMIGDLRRLIGDVAVTDESTDDPVTHGVRQTIAMVEASLRFVQAFPNAPSSQMRLCNGLEGFLSAIAERVQALSAAIDEQRNDRQRLDSLAHWLFAIHEGRKVSPEPLHALAAEIVAEARQGTPLRFLSASETNQPHWLARHVAAHSLTVAHVAARLARTNAELAMTPEAFVVAALVHDVGLLSVQRDVLVQAGPLSDPQRRVIERHAYVGAERAAHSLGNFPALADAVAHHHERLDGSGYPAGLTGAAIPACARWLAVADVYSAMACPRPHRAAAEPRTALTDTLMLAENGALDRPAAERLLDLAFYPVGSVIELSNGSIGRVVAVHAPRANVHAPARPVVQVLTDSRGAFLPRPETLDLAQCDGWSVVRTLPVVQRRQLLANRYPEWAA